jgi:hypothetical protein
MSNDLHTQLSEYGSQTREARQPVSATDVAKRVDQVQVIAAARAPNSRRGWLVAGAAAIAVVFLIGLPLLLLSRNPGEPIATIPEPDPATQVAPEIVTTVAPEIVTTVPLKTVTTLAPPEPATPGAWFEPSGNGVGIDWVAIPSVPDGEGPVAFDGDSFYAYQLGDEGKSSVHRLNSSMSWETIDLDRPLRPIKNLHFARWAYGIHDGSLYAVSRIGDELFIDTANLLTGGTHETALPIAAGAELGGESFAELTLGPSGGAAQVWTRNGPDGQLSSAGLWYSTDLAEWTLIDIPWGAPQPNTATAVIATTPSDLLGIDEGSSLWSYNPDRGWRLLSEVNTPASITIFGDHGLAYTPDVFGSPSLSNNVLYLYDGEDLERVTSTGMARMDELDQWTRGLYHVAGGQAGLLNVFSYVTDGEGTVAGVLYEYSPDGMSWRREPLPAVPGASWSPGVQAAVGTTRVAVVDTITGRAMIGTPRIGSGGR